MKYTWEDTDIVEGVRVRYNAVEWIIAATNHSDGRGAVYSTVNTKT